MRQCIYIFIASMKCKRENSKQTTNMCTFQQNIHLDTNALQLIQAFGMTSFVLHTGSTCFMMQNRLLCLRCIFRIFTLLRFFFTSNGRINFLISNSIKFVSSKQTIRTNFYSQFYLLLLKRKMEMKKWCSKIEKKENSHWFKVVKKLLLPQNLWIVQWNRTWFQLLFEVRIANVIAVWSHSIEIKSMCKSQLFH